MISEFDFDERVEALWKSQKGMAAPKKFKNGKRQGAIRRHGTVIEFTQKDLAAWLWTHVGVSIARCPYCSAPIDILTLTIDHITPRALGGRFSLENMQAICKECNERKGRFTDRAFRAILEFARTLGRYDEEVLLGRLRQAAAFHGTFRKPADPNQPKLPPPPKQNSLDLAPAELGEF